MKKIKINFNEDLVYNDGVKQKSKFGIILSCGNCAWQKSRICSKSSWIYKKKTLICEYAGYIFFLRNKMISKNYSIMDLIIAPKSDISLVICPEKNCYLVKILLGINNKKSSTNQNAYSIRAAIDGWHVLLFITKKNICKSELLYYDYNAGGYNNYNTNNFI